MKRFILAALALSSVAAAAVPASAATWMTINQRQANFEYRINSGIRNGAITRTEAIRLRSQFRDIAAREALYRRTGGGLDARERADLDARMNVLNRDIHTQRHDYQRTH